MAKNELLGRMKLDESIPNWKLQLNNYEKAKRCKLRRKMYRPADRTNGEEDPPIIPPRRKRRKKNTNTADAVPPPAAPLPAAAAAQQIREG